MAKKKSVKKARKRLESYTAFVEAWNASNSVAEVSEKLDLSEQSVLGHRRKLQDEGVVLKKFPRKARAGLEIDVEELNKTSKKALGAKAFNEAAEG